jgi:hypothetical protein
MAVSDLAQVNEQIQKFWAPMFMKELRESLLLGGLVNKDYSGQIKNQGDTVKISQINAPVGQLKTVGTDADSFDSQLLSTTQVSISADKRAVAAFEFTDLIDLQSQIGAEQSAIRDSLNFAVAQQINDYLYSLVNPSTSAPDHLLSGVATFDAAQLLVVRKLAAQAKWMKEGGWWLMLDPVYMNDLLNAQTMTSKDYIEGQSPVVAGQIANQRFGFNILEDNSLGANYGLAFHPDFMHLVMQTQPTFKISDMHSQKKFSYVMSVDCVFGAKLGIAGNVKHIKITA